MIFGSISLYDFDTDGSLGRSAFDEAFDRVLASPMIELKSI